MYLPLGRVLLAYAGRWGPAPGVFIVQNKIQRNLVCYRLTPGVSGGFVPGAVNTVAGVALGQCSSLV